VSKKLRRSKNIESADIGLVRDVIWKKSLQDRDTTLLCSIRKSLIKKIPGLTEEFNKHSRYFGYWVGAEKDRAYIYIQKKKMVIDLCISRAFAKDLRRAGFRVRPRHNFQGRAGWLTGWHVPYSAEDLDQVVKWLCKAFEENL
jgi:hypothetical protein